MSRDAGGQSAGEAEREQPQGKGRPTPKRSEAQKRRGPVAPPPTNRREAAKQLREKQAADRRRVRGGGRSDDSLLLKRDQGPVRRLVRDVVDGRRTLGWVLLPVTLIALVSGFTKNVQVQALTFALMLATMAGVGADMLFVGVAIRREIRERFPDEKGRGHVAYGLMRTTVFRRWRVPRPQVHP